MKDLTAFKNKIFKYGILTAVLMEVLSLPVLGFDRGFFYGISLGTAIAIVNFNIIEIFCKLALKKENRLIVFAGYLIRLTIYGFAFMSSLKIGLTCSAGVILGFFTIKIAIILIHGIFAKYSTGRVVREEPEDELDKGHWYDFNDKSDD